MENPSNEDWELQTDLTSAAYEMALPARKARGMRPLAVAGYEVDGQPHYAPLWMRHRDSQGAEVNRPVGEPNEGHASDAGALEALGGKTLTN